MASSHEAWFGPHSGQVENLLQWIDRGELLRFGKPLAGSFIPISSFEEARAFSRRGLGRPDWTELRENAECALYAGNLLDTPAWLPYKESILDELLSMVADKVDAGLP